MKATATANSNIALVKYWGKRDKELILPMNGSVSMTLDKLFTKTTVEFSEKLAKDEFVLGGKKFAGNEDEFSEVKAFLDLVRQKAKTRARAKVVSENNFPTAAGLASSASGYAALALAAGKAAGLEPDAKELSMLARRGSGSASRSIFGGFVEWVNGKKKDGSDCYAKQIASPEHWPEFTMITTIVSSAEKKVKSRAGMAQTVASCPLYRGWLDSVDKDIADVKKGILQKDFSLVGRTAEHNCLKMHATMIATPPGIIYWQPSTMRIIHAVQAFRDEGLECYFTIDAGPQVKVMCLQKDAKKIESRLKAIEGVKETHACHAGGKARLVQEHLF